MRGPPRWHRWLNRVRLPVALVWLELLSSTGTFLWPPKRIRPTTSGERPQPAFSCAPVQAFAQPGINVQRVLTDNGGNYRSFAYQAMAGELGIGRRHTWPYRPQTNGKAEALIKTLQREWAYRRPYISNNERSQALQPWLLDYNYARPHTAIGNQPPASRL